jgi:N-hydroxyarylamine O-acetyltransferase
MAYLNRDGDSMGEAIDFGAYSARIGYRGDRLATAETLAAVHFAHALSIPFENFDPLLGVTPKLDADSLEQKLVHKRRGGYCFEHNLLFRHALEAMGFRVTGLAARVMWNKPPDLVGPRTHMLLRVDLPDGSYAADTGFGNLTLTAPLKFVPDVAQSTPHESFRLTTPRPGFYRVEVELESEWKPLYEFDLQEQQLIDYELANWFTSTHERSPFIRDLIVSRPDRDRRYALRNTSLAIHHLGGWTDRRTLSSVAELKDVLTGPLGLALPNDPELDSVLHRVATSTSSTVTSQP